MKPLPHPDEPKHWSDVSKPDLLDTLHPKSLKRAGQRVDQRYETHSVPLGRAHTVVHPIPDLNSWLCPEFEPLAGSQFHKLDLACRPYA